jgi:hypothetical protein
MDLFVDTGDLEVIGTNALEPGRGEWCLGPDAVRRLVASDWEGWGEVVLDVDNARIGVEGDVAWLATTGTVTDTIPTEERYSRYVDYARGVLADEDRSLDDRMLDVVGVGNDVLLSLPLSQTFIWPLRFTAVAVRHKGRWRFWQMQFSFATTRAPDVRVACAAGSA